MQRTGMVPRTRGTRLGTTEIPSQLHVCSKRQSEGVILFTSLCICPWKSSSTGAGSPFWCNLTGMRVKSCCLVFPETHR